VGGAILASGGSISISNSSFFHNSAAFMGGALAVTNGTLAHIVDSNFWNNSVTNNENGGSQTLSRIVEYSLGGAIAVFNPRYLVLNMTGVSCRYNSAVSFPGGNGGCISIQCDPKVSPSQLDVQIQGSTMVGNAAVNGGALSIESCNLQSGFRISHSLMSQNFAMAMGGHIYLVQSTIESDQAFRNVNATEGTAAVGGALELSASRIVTEGDPSNLRLVKNSASACGGAIHLSASSRWAARGVSVESCSAPSGGCICAESDSEVTLMNTTLVTCSAKDRGAYIYSAARKFDVDGSSVSFVHQILGENSPSLVFINASVPVRVNGTSELVVNWHSIVPSTFSGIFPMFAQPCQLDISLSGLASLSLSFASVDSESSWPFNTCLRSGFLSVELPDRDIHHFEPQILLWTGRLIVHPYSSTAFSGGGSVTLSGGLDWFGGEILQFLDGRVTMPTQMASSRISSTLDSLDPLREIEIFNPSNQLRQRLAAPPSLAGVLNLVDSTLEITPPQNNQLPCFVWLDPRNRTSRGDHVSRIESLNSPSVFKFNKGLCKIQSLAPAAFFLLGSSAKMILIGTLDAGNSAGILPALVSSRSEGPSFEFQISDVLSWGRIVHLAHAPNGPIFHNCPWKISAVPGSNFAQNFSAYPESLFTFVDVVYEEANRTVAIFDHPASVNVPGLDNKIFVVDSARASFLLNPHHVYGPIHVASPEEEPQGIPSTVFIGIAVGAFVLLAAAIGWFFALKHRRELKKKKREETNFNQLLLRQLRHGTISGFASVLEPAEEEHRRLLSESIIQLEDDESASPSPVVGYSSSRDSVPPPRRAPTSDDARPLLSLGDSEYSDASDSNSSDSSSYTYTYSPEGSDNPVPTDSTQASLKNAWMSPLEGFQPQWLIKWEDLSLDAKLGQGAFGVVWRGRWRKTTGVAIKQTTGIAMDEVVLQSFKKEALLLLNLRPHPHVVQVRVLSFDGRHPNELTVFVCRCLVCVCMTLMCT
jgi:hypothetical protein